jgi:two-component system OmpR family response regulator
MTHSTLQKSNFHRDLPDGQHVIYGKTAKGIRELNDRSGGLAGEPFAVLAQIDGKSTAEGLLDRLGGTSGDTLRQTLDELLRQGYAKALSTTDGMVSGFGAKAASFMVTALDPEESVCAWVAAQRAAQRLYDNGFFTADQPKRKTLGGSNILLVEDDLQLAEAEKMLLRREGFAVKHVVSGEAALEVLKQATLPDVVLLDVVLPCADGFSVLEAIRADERHAAVPVIMVTSQIDDEDVMQGLRAGAAGYIFKPFRPEKLIGCLVSVLGWRQT